MTEAEAIAIQDEIKEYCAGHGLWVSIEHERKPNLKMIRIKEISIKVEEAKAPAR